MIVRSFSVAKKLASTNQRAGHHVVQALFVLSDPTMMYPIIRMIDDRIFAKCRPVARRNEIRFPAMSVTFIPKIILPSVACLEELSIPAS